MGASDTAYVRQNISVSVDLPRHHSAPLLSNGKWDFFYFIVVEDIRSTVISC